MLIFCHIEKEIDDKLMEEAYRVSEDERKEKADRLKNPHKKAVSLAAGMLRRLMREKYGFCKQNISHSGDYAVCIGEERECGVDIQKICHVGDILKQRVCTIKELESIEKAPNPDLKFIELWAMKEACFKARGSSNFLDFFKKICMVERPPTGYEIKTFVFKDSYVVASCVKKKEKRI